MSRNKDKRETKENKKNKKKMKTWKKVVLVILLILAILVVWFAYRTYKNGGGLSGLLATAVGHDEYTKKNLGELKVLILGVSTDIDVELTDTIMVASYNPNTQTANLLSIPRDTYTGKKPSTATADKKINSLYNVNKDAEDVLDAVNEITGLDIQYYVLVRTEALVQLVDAIGGVEFNVPIDMVYDDPTQDLHINLQAGEQLLDGDQAEQLLRWRHSNMDSNGVMTTYPTEYGNDDFGRMRTQRDFIVATLQQTLKPSNIFKLGEILEIAHNNVETNLELSYIKDYLPYAVEFNSEDMQTASLPGTTPDVSETNGVSVFVVDEDAAEELIKSMFYPEEETTEGEEEQNSIGNTTNTTNTLSNSTTGATSGTTSSIKIELLNATGDTTKLEEAKTILENAGYTVKRTGKTSTMSKTIITNKTDIDSDSLKEIKDVLGVGDISTNVQSTSLVDVTIIIGKDFNSNN